jgi:hypothetical protein
MLEDPKVNIRLKLMGLWTSLIALYIYGDYFALYTPGKVEGLLQGTSLLDNPIKLLLAAILLAIPSLMIALSLLLKPNLCRFLNILFGMLLTIVVILVGITSISYWGMFYVMYAFLEAIITILIVWTAWRWPVKSLT